MNTRLSDENSSETEGDDFTTATGHTVIIVYIHMKFKYFQDMTLRSTYILIIIYLQYHNI